MLRDASGRLPRLWGEDGFVIRERRDPPCWGNNAEGNRYFRAAFAGTHCDRNWYKGAPGLVGYLEQGPMSGSVDPSFHHGTQAPALIGFEEDIDMYCAHNVGKHRQAVPPDQRADWCIRAGVNNLFPQYNLQEFTMCKQFEWTMCAARGKLPGQNGTNAIRLATAPKRVAMDEWGAHPIGSCRSYAPVAGCTRGKSYASSDIFYAQVCLLSAICKNFYGLYTLSEGEDFHCELSDRDARERFDELRQLVVDTRPDHPDGNSVLFPDDEVKGDKGYQNPDDDF